MSMQAKTENEVIAPNYSELRRQKGLGSHRSTTAALRPLPVPIFSTADWVDFGAGLDRHGNSRPQQDSNLGPSYPQQVAIPTELSRPPLPV